MTIRVFPRYSPRLIIVQAPDTEITIQDLHNDITDWEQEPANLSFDRIITTEGGKALGGGVSVGYTAELLDAKVGFEQRHLTLESGTVTTGDTDGLTLIDSTAAFETNLVMPGHWVVNFTDQSWCTVLDVVSETELLCFPLGDGSDNQFDIGDSYKVVDVVQCEVSGGNILATDSVGAEMSALFPTAGVNYVRTSSSSATQSELDAIQYSSYQNAVWVDNTTSTSGTAYPAGTRESPVNNLADAVSIANLKGFSALQILRSMTLDSSSDVTGFHIYGQSHVNTLLTISAGLTCPNLTISSANVTGTLDGGTHVTDCAVGNVTYVNGHIHMSGLYGTITLAGGLDAVIASCAAIDVNSPPTVDMGGSGQDCIVSDYTGSITIQNLTGANKCEIQLDGGQVTIDSTVSAGEVCISGVGLFTDNSTGTATVCTTGLLNNESISDAVWDEAMSGHKTPGSMGANQQHGVVSLG